MSRRSTGLVSPAVPAACASSRVVHLTTFVASASRRAHRCRTAVFPASWYARTAGLGTSTAGAGSFPCGSKGDGKTLESKQKGVHREQRSCSPMHLESARGCLGVVRALDSIAQRRSEMNQTRDMVIGANGRGATAINSRVQPRKRVLDGLSTSYYPNPSSPSIITRYVVAGCRRGAERATAGRGRGLTIFRDSPDSAGTYERNFRTKEGIFGEILVFNMHGKGEGQVRRKLFVSVLLIATPARGRTPKRISALRCSGAAVC